MRAQHARTSLSQWLGLSLVTQEEVAVLQHGNALSTKDLHQVLPASAALIELGALQKNNTYAHRRLALAHAFVVLTNRSSEEAKAQISAFRPPDAVLHIADFASVGLLQKELEKTVSALCGLVLHSGRSRGEPAETEMMDYLGLKCPMPIVRLSAHVRKSNPAVLDILADDRAFPADLKAWADRCDAQIEWLSTPDTLPFRVRLRFTPKFHMHPAPAASSFVIKVPPELLASAAASSPAVLAASSGSTSLLPPAVRDLGLPLLASLDYNDKRSPLHLVALQKELKQHTKAGLLRIETRDRQFLQDVQHWCEQKSIDFLHAQQDNQSLVVWLGIPGSHSPTLSPSASPKSAIDRTMNAPESSPMPTHIPSRSGTFSQKSGISPLSRDTDTRTPTLQPITAIDSLIDIPVPLPAPAPRSSSSSSFSLPPSGLAQTSVSSDSFEDLAAEPIALNFCGLKCPMPIVQLSKQVREHPKHPLKVSADDPAFPVDLKAWCDIHGYIVEKDQQQGHVYHAWLHKP